MRRTSSGKALAIGLVLAIAISTPAAAADAPVVVEGLVPDEATRAGILQRVRAIYGDARVMDRMEVGAVTAPANWSRYVTQVVTEDLRQVSAGELRVDGSAVHVSGKVADKERLARVQAHVKAAFNPTYDIHDELTVDDTGERQDVLNRALARRTVQFESGSAILTAEGQRVLDDMATAIVRVGVPQLDIVGHTDIAGDRQNNILLSVQRADAVKAYLSERGIEAQRMIVSGRGPDLPVADNATSAGRAQNRRIEFVIRRS
jgi:OOP family OmpA-OmpF porin